MFTKIILLTNYRKPIYEKGKGFSQDFEDFIQSIVNRILRLTFNNYSITQDDQITEEKLAEMFELSGIQISTQLNLELFIKISSKPRENPFIKNALVPFLKDKYGSVIKSEIVQQAVYDIFKTAVDELAARNKAIIKKRAADRNTQKSIVEKTAIISKTRFLSASDTDSEYAKILRGIFKLFFYIKNAESVAELKSTLSQSIHKEKLDFKAIVQSVNNALKRYSEFPENLAKEFQRYGDKLQTNNSFLTLLDIYAMLYIAGHQRRISIFEHALYEPFEALDVQIYALELLEDIYGLPEKKSRSWAEYHIKRMLSEVVRKIIAENMKFNQKYIISLLLLGYKIGYTRIDFDHDKGKSHLTTFLSSSMIFRILITQGYNTKDKIQSVINDMNISQNKRNELEKELEKYFSQKATDTVVIIK